MNSSLDIISIILFLGAVQGLFLTLVLFTIRRGNRIANRMLATTLLIFSLIILLHALVHLKESFDVPNHPEVLQLPFLIFGPLVYFYGKALTNTQFRFGKKQFFHFFPFVISLFLFLPFYFQSIDFIPVQPGQVYKPLKIVSLIITLFLSVQIILYFILVIVIIRNHARNIKESYSSIENISLSWLQSLIYGYGFLLLTGAILELLKIEAFDFIWILVSILMYMVGYMGLKQPEIFSGAEIQNYFPDKTLKKKYEKSTLTPEKAEEILKKLQDFMVSQKPYLDNEITLPLLAKKLSLSPHHLSQIVNEKFQQNFFEFINHFRVEEVKTMILNPNNKYMNIATLGLEAGFNSISAFNAAFKRHTKMTPSKFRDSSSPKE